MRRRITAAGFFAIAVSVSIYAEPLAWLDKAVFDRTRDFTQSVATLRVSVILIDSDLNVKPVPRHVLMVRLPNGAGDAARLVTGFDGKTEVKLPPGSYVLESDRSVQFQGHTYRWKQTVTVLDGAPTLVELSVDNASDAADAGPPPAPAVPAPIAPPPSAPPASAPAPAAAPLPAPASLIPDIRGTWSGSYATVTDARLRIDRQNGSTFSGTLVLVTRPGRTPSEVQIDGKLLDRQISFTETKVLSLGAAQSWRLGSVSGSLDGGRMGGTGSDGKASYKWAFDRTESADAPALPALSDVTRAMAMAELEIAGAHRGADRDLVGRDSGADGSRIDPQDLALFPDYLVCADAGTMSAAGQASLVDVLSAGLPVRVLLQSDDVLEPGTMGDGRVGFGRRNRMVSSMAMALNDVFVLQSAASRLFQARGSLSRGLAFRGPALFSIFSGVTSHTPGVPPYLVSALAMESRVFPAFVYDPSAGPDWASRFSVEGNPQPERDWPVQRLVFEDAHHRTLTEDVAVTAVDLMACDRRWATKFTTIANESRTDATPVLWAVDDHHAVQKLLVDGSLVREADRCLQMWRSLQELGGIHNSFVVRALARQVAEAEAARPEPVPTRETVAPIRAAAVAAPAHDASATPAPSPAAARPPGDPYIETPRCTTCNECTRINNTMFAYNDNKQTFIANLDAGTYAQLVEAAESCQVSIIHPGVPRNPAEPGLDELRARAGAFV